MRGTVINYVMIGLTAGRTTEVLLGRNKVEIDLWWVSSCVQVLPWRSEEIFLAESGVIGMCGLFWKMRGKWFRLRDCKIVALDRSFNILL